MHCPKLLCPLLDSLVAVVKRVLLSMALVNPYYNGSNNWRNLSNLRILRIGFKRGATLAQHRHKALSLPLQRGGWRDGINVVLIVVIVAVVRLSDRLRFRRPNLCWKGEASQLAICRIALLLQNGATSDIWKAYPNINTKLFWPFYTIVILNTASNKKL